MIVIVDFGSQTAHLIGRRLRAIGVSSSFCDPAQALECIKKTIPTGIIFSGGPASVYQDDAPTVDPELFNLHIPVLGICYGWQLMARLLGGDVQPTKKEYGPELLTTRDQSFVKTGTVIMSHGDTVTKLPRGFTPTGHTKSVRYAAVLDPNRNLFGVQFHPEADHTMHGPELLTYFAVTICREILIPFHLDPERIIQEIKETVGNNTVIMAVSGGVDSTVAAFLIGKAIDNHLIPVYVESGLMRPDTDKRVREIFSKIIRANLVFVDARKKFMNALLGVTDPELKRKTIGKLYVDVFQNEAQQHTDASFLGQGTIYSDVIESKGSKLASHIKSHHNVGGLPKHMHLKLLEPVRNYYKDEVRQIGNMVGLPPDIMREHPFPGPGYAVRIRGAVTEKRLKQVRLADSIVVEEMKKAHVYDKVFQCFAVMTGAYSTAVKGDERVFAEVVAIRAYESRDIMTSMWARLPYDVLAVISSRIVNEVPEVSRVVYDITTKPPATMEWE